MTVDGAIKATFRFPKGASYFVIHKSRRFPTEVAKFVSGLYDRKMTPAQCRAARGLLRWTQADLAGEAGVSEVTIRNFEMEKSEPQRASLQVLSQALEKAGVEFIPENGGGAGVRMRKKAR